MHDLADKKKKSLWYKVMYNFCYCLVHEYKLIGRGGDISLLGRGEPPGQFSNDMNSKTG